MKKHIGIILFLVLIKLIIQLIGNRNYGFHRDELLHLSVSEHLAFGFMEFPPFIGLIGKLSYWFFDYSLMGTRLFPTLAGVVILILCCQIAIELKGDWRSVLLSGVCVLSFLPFYRNHTLFQPVAFDQLFWTLGFYYIVRYIHTTDKKYLLFTGATLGVGLQNKYTMLVWAFGVLIGLLFYKKGKLFKDKCLYIAGLLALLIFLPNIIWQLQNGVPFLKHLQELQRSQLNELNTLEFALEQLNYPLTFAISIFGVIHLLQSSYRSIGVAAIVIFFSMWFLQAKPYYVFALYPVLFAAGSVRITKWLRNKNKIWIYGIATLLFLAAIPFIPYSTPVLPIKKYISFYNIQEENGRMELPDDYADMFGWNEQVRLVDSVYQSLAPIEQEGCVIWAENYGEAGALKILGKKYGLPNPISRHGSFWIWGYGKADASVWISLGNETPSVKNIFEEVELVKMIYHPYAIEEENGIPLYICRKPKQNIQHWWKDYEPYIFD